MDVEESEIADLLGLTDALKSQFIELGKNAKNLAMMLENLRENDFARSGKSF